MWLVLALGVAFFAATIAQVFGAPPWWSAFIAVPVTILAIGMLPIRLAVFTRDAMSGPFTFLAVGVVLFAGYQFSLCIGKLIGKRRP
jgi:hypothetical protein